MLKWCPKILIKSLKIWSWLLMLIFETCSLPFVPPFTTWTYRARSSGNALPQNLIYSIDALTYVIGLSQSFKLDELDPWYSYATVNEITDLKYIKYVRKSWLPELCWIAIIQGLVLNFQIGNGPIYHASLYTFTK